MSGGRATVQNRKTKGSNKTQLGDITAVDREGHPLTDHFVIECKHVADLNFEAAMFHQIGKLIQFWDKLKKETPDERMPMLIARQNRTPTVMALSWPGVERLALQDEVWITIHTAHIYICMYDFVVKETEWHS